MTLKAEYEQELQLLARNIPESTWGYLAGMLDGEGHVAIIRHRRADCSKRGYELETVMDLCNMNHDNMYGLQKLIGMGRVSLSKHYRQCGVLLAAYLRFNVGEQRAIFPHIIPYAMQKKERLEILNEFLAYRQNNTDTFEDRELKYYQFEKQFEAAVHKAKPWMDREPIQLKARRRHYEVTPPKCIEHLLQKTSTGEKVKEGQ